MADKKIQKKKDREKRLKAERVKQTQMYGAEWNMDLAADAYREKDYKTALFHVNKVLHIKPDWSHALRMRVGIAIEHEQDNKKAIYCLEKLIRKDEEDTNAIFGLANCYFEEHRHADEIELLERFLEHLKDRRDKSAREDKERAKAWIRESRCFHRPRPRYQNRKGGRGQVCRLSSTPPCGRCLTMPGRRRCNRHSPHSRRLPSRYSRKIKVLRWSRWHRRPTSTQPSICLLLPIPGTSSSRRRCKSRKPVWILARR